MPRSRRSTGNGGASKVQDGYPAMGIGCGGDMCRTSAQVTSTSPTSTPDTGSVFSSESGLGPNSANPPDTLHLSSPALCQNLAHIGHMAEHGQSVGQLWPKLVDLGQQIRPMFGRPFGQLRPKFDGCRPKLANARQGWSNLRRLSLPAPPKSLSSRVYLSSCGALDVPPVLLLCGRSAASQGAAVIVVFVVAYMQIAMLNILTGMFVETALKSAEPDRDEQALLQRRARFMQAQELERFFHTLPPQVAGKITKADLVNIATDPKLNAAFEVLGFEVGDADLFYEVLRKSCGVDEVDTKFMVDACMGMKGPATSIEMQTLSYRTLLLDERLCNLERWIMACLGGKGTEPLPS